ncbi:MAG: hypothetical protein KatS3mg087_0541 [Patescibacteria group bacterium]|nr:MAG: hypothetical protein KatS3mg087_0541 [Patescibacteria group bacterium]
MNFYVALGKSGHPIANQLFTESDIEKMKELPQDWLFVPVEVPWTSTAWSQVGGRGNSPYPEGEEQTTVRVPRRIAYQVKQYAVWLSKQ